MDLNRFLNDDAAAEQFHEIGLRSRSQLELEAAIYRAISETIKETSLSPVTKNLGLLYSRQAILYHVRSGLEELQQDVENIMAVLTTDRCERCGKPKSHKCPLPPKYDDVLNEANAEAKEPVPAPAPAPTPAPAGALTTADAPAKDDAPAPVKN